MIQSSLQAKHDNAAPAPAVNTNVIESLVNRLIPNYELEPKSIDAVTKLPAFYEKIKEYERFFQLPYSELDYKIQNTLVFRRLQQMVNTCFLNPLWKERLNNAGIYNPLKNMEEWQNIPICNKSTMRNFFMGDRPGMVVPLAYNDFEIIASGGTSSGSPSETVYALRELEDTYKIAGNFMGNYILKNYLTGDEPKWMITTLADYQMWSSGTMVGGVLQKIPNTNYIGAGPVRKEVYHHMMSYKGPKAIMGISQGIAYLTDLGEGLGETARNSFRVALYGSGLVEHRKQLELKAMYPNLNILSYFAATQAETIGLQLVPDGPLTTVPGLHLIEIVDENGKWVKEGEEGELVVTRLHAHEAPVLRFQIGDRVRRLPNLKGTGLKAEQFEFLGRSGDMIHLSDTQYAAAQAYDSICNSFKEANIIDLKALAHEIQFVNHRTAKVLRLLISVDDVFTWSNKIKAMGQEALHQLFIKSMIDSLSLFNRGEANIYSLEKTAYKYQVQFVKRWSPEIHRTELGKIPLIKDVF